MITAADGAFMARALQLAGRGRGTTAPNPCVGCVLVRDGEVVGEGYHVRAGEPHAERLALAAAGASARGATAYVTLEPCCHTGRTPPCTDALRAASVARVVVALQDPDPRVAGQGIASLEAAGIPVEVGLMAAEAARLNQGFLSRVTRGRPFVRAKVGLSVDGRTALPSGESQWITSPAARADVQRLRAAADAILTGMGTVRHDDPRLTVRAVRARSPLRVVVASDPVFTPGARILQGPGRVLILTVADPGSSKGGVAGDPEIVAVGGSGRRVDLTAGLRALGARGINDLLVEAGPTLLASLLQEGLVDELVLYMAPRLLGNGRPVADFTLPALAEARDWHYSDVRRVGPDLRLTLAPDRSGTPPGWL